MRASVQLFAWLRCFPLRCIYCTHLLPGSYTSGELGGNQELKPYCLGDK